MDESDLLIRARKFDQDALRIIFDSYASVIYKYTLRLCQDSQEADNVVGDVFAQLLEKLADGKGPETNLRSYLFQIAYHVIVNHARDRRHISSLDAAEFRSEYTFSVAAQAEDDDAMESVINAMSDHLSEEQRHVLVLRFVEGFNVRETAKIIGKSENNVKVIQNRSLAKLRQILNREDG